MTPSPLKVVVESDEFACSVSKSGTVLWTNVQTKTEPPPELVRLLNERVILEHAAAELDRWGRHYFPEFVAWLRTLGATNDDFERLGLQFLIDKGRYARRRSPLHILGYQVGKSGLTEETRQRILRKAMTEDLPNVGAAEYMATWGLPNTRRRLHAIILHLVQHLDQPNCDDTEAVAHWESDICWLKEEFCDFPDSFVEPPNVWSSKLRLS